MHIVAGAYSCKTGHKRKDMLLMGIVKLGIQDSDNAIYVKFAPNEIQSADRFSQMNLVHASDGEEAAQRELKLYFDPSELCDYEPVATAFMRAGDES